MIGFMLGTINYHDDDTNQNTSLLITGADVHLKSCVNYAYKCTGVQCIQSSKSTRTYVA